MSEESSGNDSGISDNKPSSGEVNVEDKNKAPEQTKPQPEPVKEESKVEEKKQIQEEGARK